MAKTRKKRKPKKRKIGRPSKFTKARCKKILKLVRAGNYVEVAARASGVSEVALYDWLKRGEKEKKGKFLDFLNAYREAEAEAETNKVAIWSKAAEKEAESEKKPSCKGIQGFMSRRFNKRWGEKRKSEITGEGGGPVKMDVVFPGGVGFKKTKKEKGS